MNLSKTVECLRTVQDEFRDGGQKLVVIPKYIYAVRELILLDRYETYREIEITSGISGTNLHSLLNIHKH